MKQYRVGLTCCVRPQAPAVDVKQVKASDKQAAIHRYLNLMPADKVRSVGDTWKPFAQEIES